MNLVYGRQFAWAWMKEHWAELFEKFGTGGSFTLPRLVSYSTKTLATAAEAVRRPAPCPPSNIMLGEARLCGCRRHRRLRHCHSHSRRRPDLLTCAGCGR